MSHRPRSREGIRQRVEKEPRKAITYLPLPVSIWQTSCPYPWPSHKWPHAEVIRLGVLHHSIIQIVVLFLFPNGYVHSCPWKKWPGLTSYLSSPSFYSFTPDDLYQLPYASCYLRSSSLFTHSLILIFLSTVCSPTRRGIFKTLIFDSQQATSTVCLININIFSQNYKSQKGSIWEVWIQRQSTLFLRKKEHEYSFGGRIAVNMQPTGENGSWKHDDFLFAG